MPRAAGGADGAAAELPAALDELLSRALPCSQHRRAAKPRVRISLIGTAASMLRAFPAFEIDAAYAPRLLDVVGAAMRAPAGWRPLERFDDTLDGALVRVIPDRDEFQRLCERPAPGAVEAVEWCDDMEAMCGRHYAIEAVYSNSCGYELTKSDTDDTFAVPFDACMFVSRDTSPEFRERFDVYI